MTVPIPRRRATDLLRIAAVARRLFPLFPELARGRWEGVTATGMDRAVRRYLQRHGLVPALEGYRGYPASSSVSVNSVAIHGVPGERSIQRGDLFTVDVAARAGIWVTDAAWTYLMPGSSDRVKAFYQTSWTAFRRLLGTVKPGMSLFDLAERSQSIADELGLTILPEFVGHGIGRELHEAPVIPFTVQRADSRASEVILADGMVVNIEPVYGTGAVSVHPDEDGWGYRTNDGSVTSHFELTLAIGPNTVEVLQFDRCSPGELPESPPFGDLHG